MSFCGRKHRCAQAIADGAPAQIKVGDSPMSKEQRSNREAKKVAAMTPKEKKAAKRAKKEQKGILGK